MHKVLPTEVDGEQSYTMDTHHTQAPKAIAKQAHAERVDGAVQAQQA
jgi:hypothetical protein